MERSEQFRSWVDALAGGGLTLPELVDRVERRPDGTTIDLLVKELGGDPWAYICRGCFEEVEPGTGTCQECLDYSGGGSR